jgi:anti-sigma factor RsiW
MTNNHQFENPTEHAAVSALIPWYVNDTLADRERQRVDAHAGTCAACRDDLAVYVNIFDEIDAQPALDYVPVASLRRLQARLDVAQAEPASEQKAVPDSTRREMPWLGWMAASIGALAVAIGLLAADRWVQLAGRASQPNYRTVTSSRPRPPGEVIRAVFSPEITLVELQKILDEAQLKIVSGPTEAGVYSLASNSSLTVRASLTMLREHVTVRFAEATLPESELGNSP